MNRLDFSRLEKARMRGGKLIARCPACAEVGSDRSGEHFVAFDEGRGRFGCIAHAGDHDHRRRIAVLLGSSNSPGRGSSPAPQLTPIASQARKLVLPPLERPSISDLDQICRIRGYPSFAGLELAVRAGMLRVASIRDGSSCARVWILLDSSRRNAQARRLDGRPFQSIGAKAKTLPGSQASWPIGAADIGDKPFVALAEGGPDFLTLWLLAWWHRQHEAVAPIFMAGTHPIHSEALSAFKGKGVFLIPHRDAAGARAQRRWTAQLRAAGASWIQPFDVSPEKDLNDLLRSVAAEMLEEHS